ncbi:MAG: peptide chain release factor 1 [Gemmataceae bacterium]|nr:peptide chain release factor 1 [Gemmataceae bacterium]
MWPAFEQAVARHAELEHQLSDPAVVSDRNRYATLAKEHGRLAKMIKPYGEYLKVSKNLASAEAMLEAADGDADMTAMVRDEIASLKPRKEEMHSRLEDLLLGEGEDFDSIIVEIRAGTGGDEAALFAGDLYQMYGYFARTKGWRIEEISFSPGEHGGYKDVVFSVTGDEVYQHLRYESGGHRVQRVPKTETQGRIHTSAATVAVMAEPDDTQVEIIPEDIEIETMRAGGAGGQHVNKTESAVRIWYKKGTPDEIEVKCQDERSQHKNRERGMRVLRSRIFERQQEKLHQERAEARRTLIGSGGRGDRIRTYNFPQNRVTDHRINLTINKLDQIIAGNLRELFDSLRSYDKKQRLEQTQLPAGA